MNKNYPVLLFIKKNEIGFFLLYEFFFVILNFINERLIFVLLVISVVKLI